MEKIISLSGTEEARSLFGKCDENLRLVESGFGVKISARGNRITIKGKKDAVKKSVKFFEGFLLILRRGGSIKKDEIAYSVKSLNRSSGFDMQGVYMERIDVSSKRQFVTPKTKGQKAYVDAIKRHDIVFGIGPAGTGKTYLAMAMAVNALKQQEVNRIILTRPAIEAGESLGFLPGDLYEKVTPYLRPLYDALYDMMEAKRIKDYIERGIIEVAPLAYMRGRTLNDSFIILDEAQNSTPDQMKMFLTRLGFDSKTVITGDATQSDLPQGKESGLNQVQRILEHIKGIKFVHFTGGDVVRHALVQEIIKAYEDKT
ncbi:MAG: PhoH family protein [Candidatus Omnitrophota bacterium]|nr:PhoH family protein [Candidatus Omnitrophota bacterium]|tara:strand:+ start:313 stop:1257 length:945 start_codon:yes stop_codon:yes gene_type:complete